MKKPMNSQGPDPAVEAAAKRVGRTQLSPLEEAMFQSWATANQLDDTDSPDATQDFRKTYQETGGKVMPPGQLKNEAEMQSAIEILMRAQEEHEKNSPMKLFAEAFGHIGGMGGAEEQQEQMPPMQPPMPQPGMPQGPSQEPELPGGQMDAMLGAGGM